MIVDRLVFKKHLEKGETILFTAHKHWSQFLGNLLRVTAFGFALPWGLYFMGFQSSLFMAILVAWTALAILRLFYDFIDWYADAWLFTSMSVIVVEWHGLFSNTSKRVGYEDTEGVSYVIRGFWGTVLRFGDVTLGVISGGHVTMKHAAHPKKIELGLMKCQGQYLDAKEWQDAAGLKQLISQMVQHHMRSKK